jgi:hypothetical protein
LSAADMMSSAESSMWMPQSLNRARLSGLNTTSQDAIAVSSLASAPRIACAFFAL